MFLFRGQLRDSEFVFETCFYVLTACNGLLKAILTIHFERLGHCVCVYSNVYIKIYSNKQIL